MEFHSFTFFAFLWLVLVLHYVLPVPARRWLLLLASYSFYGAWDWRFLLLIGASTCLDYWLALRIEDEAEPARRRRWLVVSVVANLGILALFKYTNFFIASFCALTGADPASHVLPIVLPVGISFFTFQSMSYTIDVYRGHIRARSSISRCSSRSFRSSSPGRSSRPTSSSPATTPGARRAIRKCSAP